MSKHGEPCFYCGATLCHQKWKRRIKKFGEIDLGSEMNPVDGFICPECETAFRVSRLETDGVYIHDWQTEYEFPPRFCPNCGTSLEGKLSTDAEEVDA